MLNQPIPASTVVPFRSPHKRAGVSVFKGDCAIQGLGHWTPSETQEIRQLCEGLINKNDEPIAHIIKDKTGISEVRVVDKKTSVSSMAVLAIENLFSEGLFSKNSATKEDIDVIIYCGISRECVEPATAVLIQNKLGIKCVNAFDVSNACLGFMDSLGIANAFINSNQADNVLVVAAETLTHYGKLAVEALKHGENSIRHFASLTLGDGAVAALITTPNYNKNELRLKCGIRQSFGEHSGLCVIKNKDSPMITHAAKLFATGLAIFPKLVKDVLLESQWNANDVDLFVPHQASDRTIKSGADSLGIPMEKVAITVQQFGNMASVALPFSLSKAITERGIKNLNKILLVGLGSGLGISVMSLEAN